MAKHAPGFLKLVNEARKWIVETDAASVKARLDRGEKLTIIDVREDGEFAVDHVPGAIHMGKGIIERDIEAQYPDTNAELILYCGGGYRSALAAEALGRMGYRRVISMDGGIRAWRESGFPLAQGPNSPGATRPGGGAAPGGGSPAGPEFQI